MADYTIANLKDDLEGILHGTTLNKVQNFYALCRRAARNVLMRIDPEMTIRIAQITTAIHDDIYDYSCPADLKGRKVIDIRPQINRELEDLLGHRYIRTFDLRKKENTFTIRFNKGEKTLRLSKTISPVPTTLHQMDSLTDNGTWSAGGDATNLTRDTLDYISGSASLNFDLDGSGTSGYIENSTMDAVDLSDQENIGQLFVRLYIPDTDRLSGKTVELRWGSSSSAYWKATASAPHDQTTWKRGWNILRFDWNGATKVGSPDASSITYLRVTINYDGTADTDFRVDKISCSAGEIWEIVYYSEYLFRDTSGNWKEIPSDDSDLINLDEDGYNIFVFECALAIAQQVQGADSAFDVNFFREELYGDPRRREKKGLYWKYNEDHPSQAVKPKALYWRWDTFKK